MTRQNAIGFGVILLIMVGILALALTRPIAPPKKPADTGLITENTQYYTVKAAYPTETPLLASVNADADAAAVATMKQYEVDTIAQFKTEGNFANLTPEDITMMGFDQGRQEAIDIEYTSTSSPKTVSYTFAEYLDTFGAHPNEFYRTFTFDTTTGANLALSDLFTPGSDYLQKLSDLSRADLPGVIGTDLADPDYIASGTTPDDTSFQTFTLDPNNLILIFPPYQVGPYAIGTITLYIPRSALTDILKPEYQ